MKTLFMFMSLFILGANVQAADIVVKECTMDLKMSNSDKLVDTTFKITSKDNALSVRVIQVVNGQDNSYDDVVSVEEGTVRENLGSLSEDSEKNSVETIIYAAIGFEKLNSDPEMPKELSKYESGIDLTKVRSAKVYTIGKTTHMGATYIVEAKDEKGQVLGSFYTGFFQRPCKK